MKRLLEEEELNLQDLIFILLFFFIIAQTLIVFKVQKDLIVPPKVDKDPELVVNEDEPEIITLIIDDKSTVAMLAGSERREVINGFDAEEGDLEATYEEYCDPAKNKDLFLPSEDAKAYETITEKVKEMKTAHRFSLPIVGLIADHRARYGTIFQVNVAVQELIKEEEIDPTVKWKVFVDKSGNEDIYDQFPDAIETDTGSGTGAQPEEQQ